MFVYQEGKLYAQHDDKLVGVDVTPTGISEVESAVSKMKDSFEILTYEEVFARFGIAQGMEYKFPIEKKVVPQKEVETDGKATTPKKSTGKSTRK